MVYQLKRIKADGKRSAKIALVGEAGGRDEYRVGRPFVGWSGHLLSKWWSEVGLSRKDFWIDNVYPFTPPFRGGYPQLSLVHPDDLKFWAGDLHDRLKLLTELELIIPVGDLALKAITGMKGISKYRGSILAYERDGRAPIKVIPTLHPAYTARRPTAAKACIADWRRIAEESQTPEIKLPARAHITNPIIGDIDWFISKAQLQWKPF